MDTTKLTQINKTNADNQLSTQRHDELLKASVSTSSTVLSATASLIKYLEGHVTKTQVINQLESIATPDALEVIPHIEALHATIKAHKDVDLTELTSLMSQMVAEAKLIPKDLPKTEKQQFVDYSAQFKELGNAVKAVEGVIKAQKTVVEAPVVNVDAPTVNVAPPDLKPLQGGLKDVVSAIKKIVIPEYKTDNAKVEALITKSNKLLKELIDKPVSRGGGGGIVSYVNASGIATPVTLTTDGKIPTIDGGFNPDSDITTEIITVGSIKTITQTDGVKTATITIDSTNPDDKIITKVWS